MKTTAKKATRGETEDWSALVNDLATRYGAARRWALMRLLEGRPAQDVWERTRQKFRLDARQANDAVHDAQTVMADLL